MRVHRSLRLSGGSGCIKQQRQTVRRWIDAQIAIREARVHIGAIDHFGCAAGKLPGQCQIARFRDDEFGAGIAKHRLQAIARVTRVQDNIEFSTF